jgi:hypothetical protein
LAGSSVAGADVLASSQSVDIEARELSSGLKSTISHGKAP